MGRKGSGSGSTRFLLVCTATLNVALFLVSSMILLSTIITWLSVNFSGPLPHLLGFAIGVLSFADAVALLLLIGIKKHRQTLGFISLILTVITFLVSVALLIPLLVSFASFCEACTAVEQTQDCVDTCIYECCFRDLSRPILIVLIASSCLAAISCLLGIAVSLSYLLSGHRKQY